MRNIERDFDNLSDEALMYLLQKEQSKNAFEILYDRYFNKLVYFCYKYNQSQAAAEDIVHDCFLKLIQQAASFDTQLVFSTWIYNMVKNASINAANKKNRRLELAVSISKTPKSSTNQQSVDASIMQTEMQKILTELSEKDRLIYVLRIEQQVSIKETAIITQMPEGSVKSSLYYTLKKIAQRLKVFIHE